MMRGHHALGELHVFLCSKMYQDGHNADWGQQHCLLPPFLMAEGGIGQKEVAWQWGQ